MIRVTGLKVRSLDIDFNEVSWRVEDTTEDVLDYTFQVLRSEATTGPWDVLSAPLSDRYTFYDRASKPFHAFRSLSYKLRVTHTPSGKWFDTEPADRSPDVDLVVAEIRRHVGILHREFTGRRCWVLPVRTFGQRCSCWSPVLQKRTKSACRTCYDTGFVRGYMDPCEMFIQVEPGTDNVENTTPLGAMQSADTVAQVVAGTVTIKPRDVVIEPENRRWRVTRVGQTEHGRAPILLTVHLHEIPKGDIEYALELKMERALKDMWLSPMRNFSNPQNLEAFDAMHVGDILDFYNGGSR